MKISKPELTKRDADTLRYLEIAIDRKWGPGRDGWVRPMDIEGRNGSHHSATLAKLVKLGLAESKRRVVSFQGAMGSKRAGRLYRFKSPSQGAAKP